MNYNEFHFPTNRKLFKLQRLLFKTNEGESGAGASEAQNQNNQKTTEKGKTQTMSTRRLLVISLLINVSLEKRNAQLLCAHDGQGLNDLMSFALENNDVLVMKIARNVASHDGPTQSMFAVILLLLYKLSDRKI